MAKKPTAAQKKVQQVMHKFQAGNLRTGKPRPSKGPKITSRQQAIAIALGEAGKAKPAPKGKSKGSAGPGKR